MKILVGDILKSNAQTLINTVNCVGIMGKGIALEFKKRFPEMFEEYAERCRKGELRPGIPHLYKTLIPPQVVNFPTKDHWRSVSKVSDVQRGLEVLVSKYREWGITSLAIPPLGCGNGQLDWSQVGPLIYRYAQQMDIPVEMYAPYGTPPPQLTESFLEKPPEARSVRDRKRTSSSLNPAWVALVEILSRIEKEPYHWPVGRTVFQKIAYVATREGLPTGFEHERSSFGPFSTALKSAQTKLVNSNVIQEERHGNLFVVKVGPGYENARRKFQDSLLKWEEAISKTTDLFMRTNTQQAEIVATVLFSVDTLEKSGRTKPTERDVLEFVMNWKQKRRPPLTPPEVASTIRNLAMLRWIHVEPSTDLPLKEEEASIAI